MVATLISCDHIFVPHPFAYAIGFLTSTTPPSRGFLMGQRYYLRGVRLIAGRTVIGAVTVVVALPAKVPAVDVVRYA